MEVRPAYKQTEVGVIPDDWDAPFLGDLFTFKNGLNKAKEFFGHGTPIVNYMDVYGKRGLLARDLRGRVSLSKQELRTFDVRRGDVFFTRTSETAEEVGMTSVMLDVPEDTVFSGFVLRARPVEDSLEDQFKKYCFSTSAVRKQITSQSTETTRALTNGRYLSAVVIARPPKPEQRAIAEALSDADALIESLEQLVAKKRQLKQGAMQELLTGKKRPPGFSGEWKVAAFGDLLRHHSGNSTLIKGKLSDLPLAGYFDAYSASGQDVWHHSFEHEGDALIVSAVGSRCGKTFKAQGKWSAIANTHVVWPNRSKVDAGFLLLFLDDEDFWLKSGSGQPFVLFKQSFARTLQLPSLHEQAAIAAILSDMHAEIVALEAKLAKARDLKQGMMQELLTGRIRLV